MNQNRGRGGHVEIVFPIVLFLVFTLSALVIILYAARTYQHIVDESATQYSESTSLAYLSQKIHASDTSGSVKTEKLDGHDALALYEDFDGVSYVTYLYVYDGYLRELFMASGADISPAAGTQLFEADDLSAEFLKDDLLNLTLTSNGNELTELIAIRSSK